MFSLGRIKNSDYPHLKKRLLHCAQSFSYALILDSNSTSFPAPNSFSQYELVAGFSNSTQADDFIHSYDDLSEITSRQQNWYLGYLSYDLKNYIENLDSNNTDNLNWPPLLFFKPQFLFLQQESKIEVLSNRKQNTLADAVQLLNAPLHDIEVKAPKLQAAMPRNEYLERVSAIQKHIHRGDLYEVNYCLEFNAQTQINPYQLYTQFTLHTPAPFASFLKYQDRYLLSASPERFLQKHGDTLISQPIKGTAPRSINPDIDSKHRDDLSKSLKERTENIMITDLVRNDLSRIALRNSVQVDELCGIYAYPHVFQMISTIRARTNASNFRDIVEATFPMGSMTGAPKIAAMQLIEKYETVKRGLYSGSVGYIAPGMDFDFNVVIRSLQYYAKTGYLSYIAGSAITALANAEDEYMECLLKAYAINIE